MEEKYYLIYIGYNDYPEDFFLGRIVKLGARYQVDNHLFLVKTKFTSQEIFTGLTRDLNDLIQIFISELKPSEGTIWGSIHKEGWKFLGLLEENKEKEN